MIANGDICTSDDARTALEHSGGDGVMVGRGAQGKPWLLAEIAHDLFGTPAPKVPQGGAFVDMVLAHFEAMLSFYGIDLGGRVARKHLGWYMDTAGTPAPLRRAVLTEKDPKAVLKILPQALDLKPTMAAA